MEEEELKAKENRYHESTKNGKHEKVSFGFPSCLPTFVLS